jgi:hypothetical protein
MASTLIEMSNPANAEDRRLELLRSAPLNSWIAISEDETKIIAVAETYGEVAAKCEDAGVGDPTIIKTPAQWHSLSL